MQAVKRLEIVIESVYVETLLRRLKAIGVEGYTVIRGASGWGETGVRRSDGVSGVFENCLILCVISSETAEAVVQEVRPILKKHGGVAMLSDAQWVVY